MNAYEEIEMCDYEIVTIKRNLAAARLGLAISAYTKGRFAKRVTIKVDGNEVRLSIGGKHYEAVVWANNQDSSANARSFKRTVDFDVAMLARFAPESEMEARLASPSHGRDECLPADFKGFLIYAVLGSGGTDLEVRTEAKYDPSATDGWMVIRASGEEFRVTLRRTR